MASGGGPGAEPPSTPREVQFDIATGPDILISQNDLDRVATWIRRALQGWGELWVNARGVMDEATAEHAPRAGSIEARLQRMEDLFEIQQLLAAYGPSADCCNYELLDSIWAEDAVYDVGGLGEFSGRAGLRAAYASDFHQQMVATGCAHVSTIPYIVLDGDRASATHHTMLYEHRNGQFVLSRLSASRWLLGRVGGRWRVDRRTNRLLNGDAAARVLFSLIEARPGVAVAPGE